MSLEKPTSRIFNGLKDSCVLWRLWIDTPRFLASWNSLQNLLSDRTQGYMELVDSMSGTWVAIKTVCTPPPFGLQCSLTNTSCRIPIAGSDNYINCPNKCFSKWAQMVLSQNKSPNGQILDKEISRQPHLIQATASAVVAAFSPWACLRENCSEW